MIERIELAPGYSISRIIKGNWQLSQGHSGHISGDPVADMFSFVENGITTFDCADIYTGVEELIGSFLSAYKKSGRPVTDVQVHTKYVPDYAALSALTRADVVKTIDRSLQRLGVDRLDLVQFSWWNYGVPKYVDAALWLKELQQQGKIRLIGLTNFNTATTEEICSAGIDVCAAQIQYSILDCRPETTFVPLSLRNQIHLLCYGSVAGGFLSERWLGVAEPVGALENRSLTKYKLIIDDFGGWQLFQELLSVLKSIADHHHVSIAAVAQRYVLDKPGVAAVIAGARNANHISSHESVGSLRLRPEDNQRLLDIVRKGRKISGDVFDVERIKEGPHGRIMKYNLNAE